jgi:hypothetical protein
MEGLAILEIPVRRKNSLILSLPDKGCFFAGKGRIEGIFCSSPVVTGIYESGKTI